MNASEKAGVLAVVAASSLSKRKALAELDRGNSTG